MNHHYRDIVDKLGEPVWWDERGVPRYCEFSPNLLNDIYVNEAILLLIECQDCGTRFDVAIGRSAMNLIDNLDIPTLEQLIKSGQIHYGDPPNYGCCSAGASMNSIPIKVKEYWKQVRFDWKRVRKLEKHIYCED